jgi:hypothetical protein
MRRRKRKLGGRTWEAAELYRFSPIVGAYVSIRQHTSAYVSIRQHTSAYVYSFRVCSQAEKGPESQLRLSLHSSSLHSLRVFAASTLYESFHSLPSLLRALELLALSTSLCCLHPLRESLLPPLELLALSTSLCCLHPLRESLLPPLELLAL